MFFRTKIFKISTGLGTCLAGGSLFKVFHSENASEESIEQADVSSRRNRQICVDGYELKMVQILVRHGARTPLHKIKNLEEVPYDKDFYTRTLPHTDYNHKAVDMKGGPRPFSGYDHHYADKTVRGGAGCGTLTTTGQEQSYVFGRLLKKQYIDEAGFIDDIFNPDQVYLRSTNTHRTIETARCVLAGMFDSRNLNKLAEPVKIHVEGFGVDPLVPHTGQCHVLRQINHAAMIHGGDLPGLRDDRAVIEKILGLDPKARHRINFVDLRDILIAQQTHGFSIPQALQPHMDMVCRNATTLMYYSFCGQHEAERTVATRLSAGPLITMMLDNMENACQNSPKLYLMATHDSTLVALLGGLGIFDHKWPPFTSDVRLELYENKEKQKFVRLSYNGEDKIINGASSELCPLSYFRKAMSKLLISNKEYKELCDSNILEKIAKELLEAEKGEVEDTEDKERSDTPAGM